MTTTIEGAPSTRHYALAMLALAVGGFAIGTTEFVTMGVLPRSLTASTSTSRPQVT